MGFHDQDLGFVVKGFGVLGFRVNGFKSGTWSEHALDIGGLWKKICRVVLWKVFYFHCWLAAWTQILSLVLPLHQHRPSQGRARRTAVWL